MPFSVSVKNTQKILAAHLKIIAALKPENELGQMVRGGAIGAHAYATKITHVWHRLGGNLQASHRIDPNYGRGPTWSAATVSLGSSPNPRTGTPANVYGYWEHDRGGEHAFYARTEAEAWRSIATGVANEFIAALPKGE